MESLLAPFEFGYFFHYDLDSDRLSCHVAVAAGPNSEVYDPEIGIIGNEWDRMLAEIDAGPSLVLGEGAGRPGGAVGGRTVWAYYRMVRPERRI